MLQRVMQGPTQTGVSASTVRSLSDELRRTTQAEVRFDVGSRALYATDASNYRQVPIGVVVPRTVDDVVATVEACRRHDVPLLSRGGGTSLCGQCCNVAVVIDFSKHLHRIIEIDPIARTARVQPGVVLDDLRKAVNQHGLTFAPDPATHTHNTLGGMIGNNSCGPHSVMGGKTQENVIALEVLTYDGTRMWVGETGTAEMEAFQRLGGRSAQIHEALRDLAERYGDEVRARYPDIPRRVSGYNLDALTGQGDQAGRMQVAQTLVGSEGTCVVVLEALVRLVPNPAERVLLVLGYPSVFEAGDHVCDVMAHGPIALEGVDDRLASDIEAIGRHEAGLCLLPAGHGWLLVEFGGATREEAAQKAQQAMDSLGKHEQPPSMKLYTKSEEQKQVWAVREAGLGATAHVPAQRMTWEGWEDAAVPPERLGEYLRAFRSLLDKHGYEGDLYGHFGQGCVHTRIDFDLVTADGIQRYLSFIQEAAELAIGMGGSISGEHGDGQSKAHLLPLMYGEALMQAFREFKAIWDPLGRMNPGKLIDARGADQDLRLGTDYDAPALQTHFRYPQDSGDFPRAVLRCVGVGECRKKEGLMCPSYMATGEELHSTRGRARMLFEMLRGDVIQDGLRSKAVKESLDLCLSCKGCKRECPVSVDMATYKAEFMAHHHEHHRRPLIAHAFGHIDRWARWASHAPNLVNFFGQTEPFASLSKRMIGIAPERSMPRFAPLTFRDWFRRRSSRGASSGSAGRVILWPDTFNNHFHPEVCKDAVTVLEQLGCEVVLPPSGLCCGRPLYEHGFLDQARHALTRILDALGDDIRAGTPIVGLEPACISVFRDELTELMPHDLQARRLKQQSVMLGEYVARRLADDGDPAWERWPRMEGKALVHGHCHHHSVLDMDSERRVLEALGLEVQVLDSGCCGMAGPFGFERDKYEVSMRCAERVLLPAFRSASPDTLRVANGYSCREQVAQSGLQRPMHLAQVIAHASKEAM